MARIRIKSPNSKDPARLKELLELLGKKDVYATKIVPAADGFVVLTENESELDTFFDEMTGDDLVRRQFTPLLPPELKASRSILIFKVDDNIHEQSEECIKEELLQQNKWIEGIASVYKFPRGRIIKVTFNETATAKKAQEKGLLAFCMRIPGYNIEQNKYLNITTCFRCYAMEDHFMAN